MKFVFQTAPFQEILNQIADENACPMSAVLLSLKERRVEPTDTPASLGLGIADLFECFIDQSWKIEKAKQEETRLAKENQLELKFQTQDRRSAVTLMVTKSMTFEEIRTIYVEKRSDKVEPSRVRFVFDGENVELDSSPEDLDMDNGDCIDVLIKL